MKPSSLAEVCSIKSSTSRVPSPGCSFLPLSEMLPQPEHIARTTKQKSWDKQQARTSLQQCFRAWPSFILYIPRSRFNYRAARGHNKELVTSHNNQALRDPSEARGKEGKDCPTISSLPFNSGWGENPSPSSQCWTLKGRQSSCVTRSTTQSRQK